MPTDTITPTVNDDDEEVVVPSTLEMSDDDFAKLSLPVEVIPNVDDGTFNTDTGVDVNATDSSSADATTNVDSIPDVDSSASEKKVATGEGVTPEDSTKVATDAAVADATTPAPGIDHKTEYEKLLKPFKANGGEIQVKNTDEILTLMQMGANYHKKMSALKPAMKLVKLLEKNNLTDESQLGFLIDLSKKDPAAIQKLVKDSGIDPLDIDVAAESYTPRIPQVSDAEMHLDDVLADIQETPTYARTLQVVTSEWDETSRNAAAGNPQIIKVINEQIGNGIYDKVMGEVNRARTLGHLQGITDFEAYKIVGNELSNKGLLQTQPSVPANTNIEVDAQKVKDEEKRNAQRKAAGSPPVKKGAAVAPAPKGVLSMSDEEFLKLPASAYTKLK